MLRINIRFIIVAMGLLFAFLGCSDDKLLLTDEEVGCIDITATAPSINTSGNFLEGGQATLSAVVYNLQGSAISYHWEGPNGFKSNNKDINFTNLSLASAGNYTVYITRNGCQSKANSTYLNVKTVQRKCNIAEDDWVNIGGFTGYENMRYSPTLHYRNSLNSLYYIFPRPYSSIQPKIEIALNHEYISEGEYTLSSSTNFANVPWGGKQATLVITTFIGYLVNYTSGKLNIVRNGKGEYEVSVCGEPFKFSSGSNTETYLLTAKFICD
jgi:hypothetical protein